MNFEQSWFQLSDESPHIDIDDDTDIRFPPKLPKQFIERLTNIGDVVFDPFAGCGTTLFAAQELGRVGIGIKYEKNRADFIEKRLHTPSKIICGDSRKMSEFHIPECSLCFTSHPYMRSFDKENPLTNYHEVGDYENYLREMQGIFRQVQTCMKPGGYVLVETENTYEPGKPMTSLTWDIGRALSDIFLLERELICCFQEGDLSTKKVNHSTILVFQCL